MSSRNDLTPIFIAAAVIGLIAALIAFWLSSLGKEVGQVSRKQGFR
jgi:hypothetical protein